MPAHPGSRSRSATGMARHTAAWGFARRPRCGSTAARRHCQSAGCCCAIRSVSSSRRRCCEPQALLCTDPMKDPLCVIGWFVQRWSVEVTFREVRDHLGFESQRQWTDKAIARTTPVLLGLFSLVALFATQLAPRTRCAVWTAAWYGKQQPTFADTLAAVRREIWKAQGFSISRKI